MSGPPSRLTSVIRFSPEAGRNANMQYIKNFRPGDVGTISFWLDASDTSTITLGGPGGTEVVLWADKINGIGFTSGKGVGTGPSYDSTGFNGYPGVVFSANRNLSVNSPSLKFSTTNSGCFFIVAQSLSNPTFESVLFRAGYAGSPPGPLDIGAGGTPSVTFFGRFDIVGSAFVDTGDPTQFFVVAFNVPPTADTQPKEYISVNSSVLTESTNQRGGAYSLSDFPAGVFLGYNGGPDFMNSPWDGPIAEILVFDKNLSEANIQKVAAYLGQKWGFQSSLTPPYDSETVYRTPRSGPLFTLRNAQI
jgi:hypothetical protein